MDATTFIQFGQAAWEGAAGAVVQSVLEAAAALYASFHFRLDTEAPRYMGAVGNAVSGYLQTKGLIDQAQILSTFRGTLDWIAALAWLFALGLGISSVAVFGNYKQALYFLIGPPLFYYTITETAPTNGLEMRFGDHVVQNAPGDQFTFLRYIRAIDGQLGAGGAVTGTTTVNVSYLFALFDSVVSEAVHRTVSMFLDTGSRDHLRFEARERALNFVVNSVPTHEGFTRLIGAIHYGGCSDVMNAYLPQTATRATPPIFLRPRNDLEAALQRAEADSEIPGIQLDTPTKRFLLGLKSAGVEEFQNVTITNEEDNLWASCEQIWGWVSGACIHLARIRLRPQTFPASMTNDTSGIPWDRVWQDIGEFLSGAGGGEGGSDEAAARTLAAFIYRNGVESGSVSALTSQVFNRTPVNARQHRAIFGTLAASEAHGGFFKLKYFAHTIPYIQGLLLYLLSIAFPFFAVFLVIPGKARSFMVWCSLWVWVKSWEVGFALVYVARDVFWYTMKDRVNQFQEELDWSQPESVISLIYNNDVFFTQNTYWEIIAILTVAVPAITAQLCMGAEKMFGMFRYSIDKTSDKFRTAETNRSRRFVGNVIEARMRTEPFRANEAYGLEAMSDRNATTPTGERLPPQGSLRGRHALAAFSFAQHMSQNGTSTYSDQLMSGMHASIARGESHPLRGMPRLDGAASPTALQRIYGSNWRQTAPRGPGGTTRWRDVFNQQSERNLGMQVLLTTAVRRKMYMHVRGTADPTTFLGLQQQNSSLGRAPGSATAVNALPGLSSLIEHFINRDYVGGNDWADRASRPGTEGFPSGEGLPQLPSGMRP